MDAIKDQSAGTAGTVTRPKLRYPLRSSSTTKPGKDNSTVAEISKHSSASKRGTYASNVNKSVSVIDHSIKDKAAKTMRRVSVPAKSAIGPLTRSNNAITQIPEIRMKRPTNGQEKSNTAASAVSKPVNRRKFSILSSASYWLSQIKVSESAAKHSISLGFFKLALESQCEPLQRMRDEFKSYARRQNLVGLQEPVKELLSSYGILEDLEQLQVSEIRSQVLVKGTPSSAEALKTSSTTGTRKWKPKSLNIESTQPSSVAKTAKKENTRRFSTNGSTLSLNQKSTRPKPGAYSNLQKKSQRATNKREPNKEKGKFTNQGKKSACEIDSADPLPTEETHKEDKENMDAQQLEEISLGQ